MMKSISWILLVCLLGLMVYADETQEQEVERLIRELQDADSDVRSNAAMTLTHEISQGNIGSEVKDVIPTLVQLLQDRDAEGFVRGNAAMVLGAIGPEAVDAVPDLIQLLQDQGAEGVVRTNAAVALGSIGGGAVDTVSALIQALQNSDVRSSAAQALVQIGTPEAVKATMEILPELIRALQDEHIDVRVNAAKALGQIRSGAKDAVPALIPLLQDSNGWVRSNAAEALGNIGEGAVDAVSALIQALQD